MTWQAWIPTVVLVLVAITGFIGRNWIKAKIDRSVQFTFDRKLEGIRAELRAIEERLKSDLRVKEAEIAALRDGALSGRERRQALLAERRQVAVERVWAATMSLGPYRQVASLMSMLKIKAISDKAPKDPALREFMETISKLPENFKHENLAVQEQPFISPMAWAYFSALYSTLLVIYGQAKILSIGIENSYDLVDLASIRSMLKKALPHQANFIDKWELPQFFLLVDELESNILSELKKMLEGDEVDKATIERSNEIIKLSREAADKAGEISPSKLSILDLHTSK